MRFVMFLSVIVVSIATQVILRTISLTCRVKSVLITKLGT